MSEEDLRSNYGFEDYDISEFEVLPKNDNDSVSLYEDLGAIPKSNILLLSDIEESFVVLGRDILKSLRDISSDENAESAPRLSDCEENSESAVFSSKETRMPNKMLATRKETEDALKINKKSLSYLKAATATPTLNLSSEDENKANINTPKARELNLMSQFQDSTQQQKDSQENDSRSQLQLIEMENKIAVEVHHFSEVLTKFRKDLKTLEEKKAPSSLSDLLHSVNEYSKKNMEIKHLIKLATALNLKLLETENEESNSYNEKIDEIFECFTQRCTGLLDMENFRNKCSNKTQDLKNIEISYNEEVVNDLKLQNDKLVNFKNALIDDQLQSIKDERTFKNIQNEFLKVQSDYNNVSNKMECLRNKRFKKDKKGAISIANYNNLAEIEKCLLEEKKSNDIARIKLGEERSSIEEEKQKLREERKLLDAERISLLEEKKSIMNENKDIVKKCLYLNREIATLKKELSERRNSTSLEEELKSITAQFNDVKEKLKISLETNSELSNEISKMVANEEEIRAYKIQIEEQQNQLCYMHVAEQNYLHQIEQLLVEIQAIRD